LSLLDGLLARINAQARERDSTCSATIRELPDVGFELPAAITVT
jgi:hypothetical protein